MADLESVMIETFPVLLEESQRLSRSLLWKVQRRFFEQEGPKAWQKGIVPHYITNSPLLAEAYAKVLFGYLRDCFGCLEPRHPVYILELGSGSGRFAFHFVKKILALQSDSLLKQISLKYVLSDFAASNLRFWSTHPSLKRLVEQGMVDFAEFDAVHDEKFKLMHSGKTLATGTVRNPLVVIANYFFDSIPQDLFYIGAGRLDECAVTISSACEEPDISDPEILDRVKIRYDKRPAAAEYYEDPDLNQILREYVQRFDDTRVLFPCAALQCISQLRRISDGRMMLVSGDKGYIHEESLLNGGDPELNLHGSFSMSVNYHAIGRYFENHGGQFLRPSRRQSNLSVCAFVLGDDGGGYVQTREAFAEAIERFGPDDFYTLKTGIEPSKPESRKRTKHQILTNSFRS